MGVSVCVRLAECRATSGSDGAGLRKAATEAHSTATASLLGGPGWWMSGGGGGRYGWRFGESRRCRRARLTALL